MSQIQVQVKKNEPIDRALKRLKKTMASEGVLRELKDRRHFQKPSEKRRLKSSAARKRKAIEARNQKRTGL